ncbi:aspartic peptidase domain-containing protein [Armillaria borealis]|uniref:Aspartic peptidase domain-containing protein n=1 Tax=Armillaria borealis TaxID=47425 RepID=A0AA39N486_9AGAR|nr:aspartic peptidase domain-containing protein [Armillaria borealis]
MFRAVGGIFTQIEVRSALDPAPAMKLTPWHLFPLFSLSVSSHLRKRDESSEYTTVTVPVGIDNGLYTVSVVMSTGASAQHFSFGLTTSTGYITVAGTSCQTCDGVQPYNRTESTTATDLTGGQNVAIIGGASADGNLIAENCGLQKTDGQEWSYANQTSMSEKLTVQIPFMTIAAVVVANQSDSMFSPGISGILGLGPNSRDGNFNATVFGGYLSGQPAGENFTYGMALSPNTGSSNNGGYLHLIHPEPSYYQGNVAWKEMQTFNTSSLDTDFYINLDSWTLTTGNGNVSRSGNLVTAIDPIYHALVFPQQDASSAVISGASVAGNTPSTNVYSIPCDTQMKIIFTISDLAVTLDESTLVVNQNGQCTGVIQQWSSPLATEYLLGSSFLSSVYVIVSISNATTGTVGFAQRNTGNTNGGLSTGAIVGIAVGSATFAALAFVAGILIYRAIRKRRARRNSSESLFGSYKEPIYFGGVTPAPPPDWVVTPFTPDTNSTASPPMSSYTHILPSGNGPSVYGGYSVASGPSNPATNQMSLPPPSYPTNAANAGGIMSITERRSQYGSPNEKGRVCYISANP